MSNLRIKVLLIVIVIIIIVLTIIRMLVVSDLEDKNRDYVDLSEQLRQIEQENSLLHTEILQRESYHDIQQKALDMGFKKGTYFILRSRKGK